MKKLILFAAPIALAACSSGGADGDGEISADEAAAEAANVSLEPGQWRTTVSLTDIEAPGMAEEERAMMQEFFSGENSTESCMTPEQAANPEAEMFGGDGPEDCSYTEFDMSGGNMVIEGSCQAGPDGGAVSMRMTGSYTPTDYAMDMETVTTGTPQGDVTMRGRITGERIGECGADEADSAEG